MAELQAESLAESVPSKNACERMILVGTNRSLPTAGTESCMNLLSVGTFLIIVVTLGPLVAAAPQTLSDFSVSTPIAAGRTLILGFMGGRDSWDDDRQGVRILALKLRSSDLNAEIETVENTRRKVALELVRRALDADGDGELDPQERQDARIILYGQSFGGAAVVKFARQLDREEIPVLLTIQIDSVGRNDGEIPANVRRAANLFQSNGIVIRGQKKIVAQDPSATEIIGNFKFDYKNSEIDVSHIPWWKKFFRTAHTRMGLDPEVWALVEKLILETTESGSDQAQ